jgi:putative tricarboxylic transport membrane protein
MKLSGLLACAAVIGVSTTAQAQEFPSETIEVVTHSGAGGGTDLTARMMMASVAPILGTDMVVVNKPGGSGAVSLEYIQQRPEDGHTILTYTTGQAVTQATKGAEGAEGLIPIARGTNDPQVLMTKCGEFEETQAFLDAQKESPLRYGVTHVANIDDVSAFMFAKAAGLQQPNIVPFEGGGDLLTNLIGGNIDVAVLNYGEAASQIDAGEVCPMVVMGEDRLATAPDTPTTADLGIDADYSTVRGFAVKEGTPPEVVEQLRAAFTEGMQSEEYVQFLESQGLDENSLADAEVWGEQMDNQVNRMREALIELGYISG